jgi:hypothetical protein
MKRILILSFMVGTAHIAFSQSHDPSYSVHNYKHPNKAEYARKHKLDKSTEFPTGTAEQNDNYKQQFGNSKPVEKAIVETDRRNNKANRSYKHPYGL